MRKSSAVGISRVDVKAHAREKTFIHTESFFRHDAALGNNKSWIDAVPKISLKFPSRHPPLITTASIHYTNHATRCDAIMVFQNLIIIPSKSTKTQFVKVIQLAMGLGMGGEQQETKRKIKSNVRTTRKNKKFNSLNALLLSADLTVAAFAASLSLHIFG